MMDTSLTAAIGVGFLLGVRHAADVDHIAAISAFVSQDRSLARSCLLGTFWGAGHTAALLGAGLATIGFKMTISPALGRAFETLVALVLILLGGHVVLRTMAMLALGEHAHGKAPPHVHIGGDVAHSHAGVFQSGRRPFVIGVLHGMAGSAALMLFVLATIPSPLAGVLYIAMFGLGSTAGMLALSGLIAVPFVLTANRGGHANTVIRLGAGLASVVLGAWLLCTQP
ncbi:MAG TPA: urease accessory protein UreH [Methylomirabilota bacterium]|jgi:high-affinity nickel-transport protein